MLSNFFGRCRDAVEVTRSWMDWEWPWTESGSWDWEWPWTWPSELPCPCSWNAQTFSNTVLVAGLATLGITTFTVLLRRAKRNSAKEFEEEQRRLVYQRLLKLVVEKLIQRHLAGRDSPVDREISLLNRARYLQMLHTTLNDTSCRTLSENTDPERNLQDEHCKEVNRKLDKVKDDISVLLRRMKRLKVDEIFSPELQPIISELELDV